MRRTEDGDLPLDQTIGKRALRRHHKWRMRARARHIAGIVWRFAIGDTQAASPFEQMERNADHLKACSCEMCRNPRRSKWLKNKGKTIKELQAEEDLRDAQE